MEKTVVLIDDDRLTHICWRLECLKANVLVKSFRSVVEFIASHPDIDKHTFIFVDSELGNGIKGEV